MSLHIDPGREQFDQFKSLPRDVPIMMLNLIRLRQETCYEQGDQVSGAEGYARYGKYSGPIFQRVGGEIIWRGRQTCMLIGPSDKQWDLAFIARYPSANAFLEMITDPEYKKAVIHRTAAVEDSRLIRFEDAGGDNTFG